MLFRQLINYRRIITLTLTLLLLFSFSRLSAQTVNETLPAGTWIIAMDNALQENNTNRVRRAYGLAVHLLHAGVPLKWIIDPNKTNRTAVDFSASARRRFPSTSGYSNRSFRTGPLAIFPGFEAEAQTVINNYGNDIRVYELQNATVVPVNSNLSHKPKVLVEDEKDDIHTDILSAAGLQGGTHYNVGNLNNVGPTSCVTIITVPHNKSITTQNRNSIKNFVRAGGNFLAQCAAVRGFQGSTPRVFSNAGFVDEPGLGTFLYDNPQEPSAQFEGTFPDEGGSLENFAFQTDPPGGTRIVHDSGNDFKAYTGRIDGFSADAGGYVHYLGGHNYDGDIDADRYYLNAVLRSADRPDNCGLTIQLVNANDDAGTIDCAGSSVTIDVLANDDNPQGTPLTVTLLGSGSNGTFVNNGNGTVTYTGNVGGFWGGDEVTYEACDGTICDQATITITSSNPSMLTISGTVFEDDNSSGTLNNGESGPAGVTVRLYEDTNGNGVRNGGEPLLQSTTTVAGGDYTFVTNSAITPPTSVSFNDRVVNNDSWQNSSGQNFTSNFESGTVRYKGYRWTNLNIPANATITNATVRVTGYSGGGVNVAIRAEDQNAAPNYSGTNNYLSGRAVTASSVNWSVPSLNDNTNYTSPNFASVVQEVVNNNGGLTHLSLILRNTTGTWISWNLDDGVSSKYQRLNLTYTTPGSEAIFVMEVDATTLPSGATFTTDNVETADFSALGQLDCNNNFGFETCPALPDAGTDGSTVICAGVSPTTINLFDIISGEDAGGAWSETTSGPNSGVTIGDGTSVNFSSAPVGVYEFTYTVTAENCPTDVSTATITVPPTLLVSLDSKTDASCNAAADGTINITASGGTPNYTFAWSDGSTDENRTSLAAGNYTVTVTDANGCTATLSETIEETSDVAATATANDASCNGDSNGSILVTATGATAPFDVAWSGPSSGDPAGDEIATSGGSYNITGLASGSYNITVTDNVGCTATLSRTVGQPSALAAVPTATGYACFGETGNITLSVSGGTGSRTFSWSGPDGFSASTRNISNLSAGTYNVTVTDANGCTTTAMATVTGPSSPLTLSLAGSTDVSCDAVSDGTANVTASGGSEPYTFLWNDGSTSTNRTGLAAGQYVVVATDANGCTAELSVTINQQPSVSISIAPINPSCPPPVAADGSITLSVTSGTPLYTFAWTTGDGTGLNPTSQNQTGLSAGTYSVTVTDANGCTASTSTTLVYENQLPVTPGPIDNN